MSDHSTLASAPGPRPVRITLAEQTAQILRDRIVWGDLPAGARLVETEVARDLGVSRTPVREALQRLESDGLAVRQGTTLLVAPFDQEVAVESLIMRELLEPFATRESVRRLSGDDVAELRAVLAEMERETALEHPSAKRGAELNIRFHNLLNSRCPYHRIVETIRVARDAYSALRLYSSYTREDLARVQEEHVAIVEAAAAAARGDASPQRVAKLIAAHMKAAREALLRNTPATDDASA